MAASDIRVARGPTVGSRVRQRGSLALVRAARRARPARGHPALGGARAPARPPPADRPGAARGRAVAARTPGGAARV